MSLPPEVQPIVDKLRAVLGVPACQLQINIDRDGVVQGVQSMVTFQRTTTPNALDKRRTVAQS